jgi:hypothetical protein
MSIGPSVVLLALLCVGCKMARTIKGAVIPMPRAGDTTVITQLELRERLDAFYSDFVGVIEFAAAERTARASDPEERRRVVLWKMRAINACRAAVFQQNPLAAFLDTWTLCVQFEQAVTTGEEADAFGEAQPVMVQAAQRLRRDIEALGESFLPAERIAELRPKIEKFARENPVGRKRELVRPSKDAAIALPEFGWLLRLPMAPFRAFEGVNETAAALHEFTLVADRFERTVEHLPKQTAWEVELLLLDARREVEALLAQLDAGQSNLQATLQLAHQTTKSLADAGAAWQATLQSARSLLDAIMWRIIVVIAAAFALAFAYRLATRSGKRSPGK